MVRLVRRALRFFLRYGRSVIGSDPLSFPLTGDRCIEYAFVVRNLLDLDKNEYRRVLDIGCFASPLTTIISEIGFAVDGIDLVPAPYAYEGVNYFEGDFLVANLKDSFYGAAILCSTIEHIGLGGRYGSPNIPDGDVRALKKAKRILRSNGMLILTVPYGKEKIIWPLHRVYNKSGKLLRYAYSNFEIVSEEFYMNNYESVWVKCSEDQAREVVPTEDNYALGLFAFRKNNDRPGRLGVEYG